MSATIIPFPARTRNLERIFTREKMEELAIKLAILLGHSEEEVELMRQKIEARRSA